MEISCNLGSEEFTWTEFMETSSEKSKDETGDLWNGRTAVDVKGVVQKMNHLLEEKADIKML